MEFIGFWLSASENWFFIIENDNGGPEGIRFFFWEGGDHIETLAEKKIVNIGQKWPKSVKKIDWKLSK